MSMAVHMPGTIGFSNRVEAAYSWSLVNGVVVADRVWRRMKQHGSARSARILSQGKLVLRIP